MAFLRPMIPCVAAGLISLTAALDARGHHSFGAEFDAAKPVTIEGTISRVEWVNPHTSLYLDVTTDEGKTIEWMFQGSSPGAMQRYGLNLKLLEPGTPVVIQGYESNRPHCDPTCRGSGHFIFLADGRKIYIASSGVGTPEE
jgi:hypothetical protein